MEEEKNVVEQLENYLDDYTRISIESTIKALDIIYKGNKEATTPVFLKIIRHINNRIDEVVNFAYIVSDSRYDEKEKKELAFEIDRIEQEMREAARNLDFERAMELRDILFEIKTQ